MKTKITFLFIVIALANLLSAQHKETPFLLDVFEQGVLTYKDGSKSEGLFNYNTVSEKMVFVAEDSTVMQIANPSSLLVARIGDRFFEQVKNGVFYERIVVDNDLFLYVRWHSEMFSEGKTGPYGMKNTSSSVESKTSMYTPSGFTGLSVDESYIVKAKNFYYVKNKGKFRNVTKESNFIKLFKGQNATDVKSFIKNKNLDWNNVEDVKKALLFASKYMKE